MEVARSNQIILDEIEKIINETEDRIDGIFEYSSILEASYREQGYLKIVELIDGGMILELLE